MEIKTQLELIKSNEIKGLFEEYEMNPHLIDDETKYKEHWNPKFIKSIKKKWVALDDDLEEIYRNIKWCYQDNKHRSINNMKVGLRATTKLLMIQNGLKRLFEGE